MAQEDPKKRNKLHGWPGKNRMRTIVDAKEESAARCLSASVQMEGAKMFRQEQSLHSLQS
jgi:hypothetical protein